MYFFLLDCTIANFLNEGMKAGECTLQKKTPNEKTSFGSRLLLFFPARVGIVHVITWFVIGSDVRL